MVAAPSTGVTAGIGSNPTMCAPGHRAEITIPTTSPHSAGSITTLSPTAWASASTRHPRRRSDGSCAPTPVARTRRRHRLLSVRHRCNRVGIWDNGVWSFFVAGD